VKKVVVENVLIFAQMLHDHGWENTGVVLLMLKPSHQNTLVATVSFIIKLLLGKIL
jgi:hypothetical protein